MEITPMHAPVFGAFETENYETKDFSDKISLIDADYLKYLVADDMYKRITKEKLAHSKSALHEIIDSRLACEVFNLYKAKSYVFCFSAPSKKVFRNHIAQEKKYKGNREGREDKTFYLDKYDDMAYVFTYIQQRYQVLYFDDLEADDIVSMLQTEDKTFICSIDKDLKQVPGFHFDKKTRTLNYTSEEEGFNLLIRQTLKGDSGDNIPGLFGCGEKRIEEIFKEEKENYAALIDVLNEYITKKKSILKGVSTFVEMFSLVATKTNRGDYFREKYLQAFILIESLIENE
jgi:5'-3' exonuclease